VLLALIVSDTDAIALADAKTQSADAKTQSADAKT